MWIRVECGIFFFLSEQVKEPKVEYDFRSPNPKFWRVHTLAHASQSFHFQKIPGGQNINIFCENWHETSFYIKEQTQKKCEILLLKATILDPRIIFF